MLALEIYFHHGERIYEIDVEGEKKLRDGPYEVIYTESPFPAQDVVTPRGSMTVHAGMGINVSICQPGEVAFGWVQLASWENRSQEFSKEFKRIPEGQWEKEWQNHKKTKDNEWKHKWQLFCQEYGEDPVDWFDAQVEAELLHSTLRNLESNYSLPVEATDNASEALNQTVILPGQSVPDKTGNVRYGWSYSCPNLRAAAWVEVWSLAVAGLKVKKCKKCKGYFVPWPPQRTLCDSCQRDYTWQTLYRQRKKGETKKNQADSKNIKNREKGNPKSGKQSF